MTDIKRHLKGIRKILHRSLDEAGENNEIDFPALRSALRDLLPQGYGIGCGHIVGNDERMSQMVHVLVYDVPLSKNAYNTSPERAGVYHIDHVLLVIDAAVHHTIQTFTAAVDRIASVKVLQTSRIREPRSTADAPVGQVRRVIPKDRLPFALLTINRLADASTHALAWELHTAMRHHTHDHLPDQIDVREQQLQYLNRLLESEQASRFDIGWSRVPDLRQAAICYGCKQKHLRHHFHYERLCIACGDLNYSKRMQFVDLNGYIVLVTGGRVKIGYATALRLLRAGARVIVTSRFPRDAARRYVQEPDFSVWRDRLHIYGMDLRQITADRGIRAASTGHIPLFGWHHQQCRANCETPTCLLCTLAAGRVSTR
jgi:hypothetical protein